MKNAIVIGGGIGGLAVAAGLRRSGLEPVVLERAPELRALGAGITLAPNAMRALARLGLADAVAARGAPVREIAVLDTRGRTLQKAPADLIAGGIGIHRADLQAAVRSGDERLGSEVRRVETDGTVLLADGATLTADVVVGADGIHSITRSELFPDIRPVYAGYTAWRAVAPVAATPGRWSESWGRGARFGLIDIGGDRTYWFATKNASEGDADGGKDEIADRFSSWHDPIRTTIEATPPEAILRNDVYYLDSLDRWSAGRVTLLGDAAHAATPGLGQGAAQAIEDAVVLARSLREHERLEDAFAAYEAARRPRTQKLFALARRADKAAQLESRLGCAARNILMRRMPGQTSRNQYRSVVEVAL